MTKSIKLNNKNDTIRVELIILNPPELDDLKNLVAEQSNTISNLITQNQEIAILKKEIAHLKNQLSLSKKLLKRYGVNLTKYNL